MPDSLPLLLLALGLVAALRWLSTALATGRGGVVAPAPGRDTEARFHVACHRPSCGHIERPHDVTDEGLRCTHCGLINADS
ncbi:hypothetical protein JHN55_31640 [Streptomyces sp. MBT56]|uniref:hypothetical protein n=1 Tax=unclassified Streptomyces TaxID=2593676 RepID=UPI00190CD130|nr:MULTISPECIES: hypothetical protein [unclassified Streptomyces]MBK3561006.1 hypothetical protein [Streptomyces sp. MBT56]MBK3605620.1 hypothetical protein [Streptomyces sp. MBT54]MBK3619917.1 hypothetical protein [Streptomyces sp. MBT98]